ncbi:MAG: hypothetical protein JWR36_1793 [Glaciihabitans sp.]|jgi:membrane associated rhomboid family serine protease|nr:hypothetical protein [Glaciihabitans sp.]MDQ1571694.1 hypothetical protein [Actinomycetota bacterium]
MSDQTTVINRCYRHPDRESFVRCQRCGRTVCGECQTLAAVGVHCPECVREARASAPRVKPRVVTAFSKTSEVPVVTYIVMGIVAVLSVIGLLPKAGDAIFNAVAVDEGTFLDQPWTAITHVLVNFGGVINIAFALLTLFWFGRMLEGAIGRIRFVAFVVLTALGGAAAVILLHGGAQAGTVALTTGILAGVFILQRHLAFRNSYLLLWVGISVFYNVVSGGGWEGIVGGVIAAGVTSLILLRTRRISRRGLQTALLVALGVLLVAVCVVGSVTVVVA